MKSIITEEMRYRKNAVKYVVKCGNYAQAARRYIPLANKSQDGLSVMIGVGRVFERKVDAH